VWNVTFSGRTAVVSDYAVQVSIIAQTNPPQIALVWPADPGASGYTVYRKAPVVFYANGIQIGQTNAPPYSLLWSNVPGGSYALTARALCGSGWATNSSAVNVQVDNGGSPFLTISPLGNLALAIAGDDVLGRTYHIEFLDCLNGTNWQILGAVTSSPSGSFQFIDLTGAPQRFYRSG